MSILDNFKSEKRVVGVSLTPGIGLEAVVLDKTKKYIEKYGKRDVAYNFSTREIQNMVQFKNQLAELMEELAIPPKSEISLVLPNILFDFVEAPPELSHEEIKTMILTKAEEFYLFKKDEPVSGFCEVVNFNGGTQKKYAYASFQKEIVDQIKDTVNDLGFNIVSIESSYSATIRGLYLTGLIDDVCMESEAWTLMLISSNSYTLFQMEGKNIVSYNDIPLAIKSFSVDEAYQTIIQGASQLLSNYISSKLFIASQTDEISAEYLKKHIRFDRDIIAIESNKFSQEPIMRFVDSIVNKTANAMTLTAIGAASGRISIKFILNVLQDDPKVKTDVYVIPINGVEYELFGSQVDALAILATVALGVVMAALVGSIFVFNSSNAKKIEDLNAKIAEADAQIAELSKVETKVEEVDIESIIDEVAETNVSTISFYDSIATDIPKNVWLTKYYNKSGRDIVIKGIAESIIDIYEYYKNLKTVSPQADIRLTELKVVTSDDKSGENKENRFISGLNIDLDKTRLYSFEISNTQLQPLTQENIDENDLLRKTSTPQEVEETSEQMTPTSAE